MYFFEDGVAHCGFYECRKCNYRFLSRVTTPTTDCPLCEQSVSYEIGPEESLEDFFDTADLVEEIDGVENIERMDTLLSVAFTEDESWI